MNQLCDQVRTNANSRQVRLRIFLLENGIESRELAKKRGLSPGAMGDVLSGRRPKREHIEWLISQGIPANLLPEPAVLQRRGPKPKDATQAA